jgi:hypothetical protein
MPNARHPGGRAIIWERWWGSERALLNEVAHRLKLEHHGQRGAWVVGVNHEQGRLEVGAWLLAEPADDRHAAVVAVVVDKVLSSQVMVEVDLVPGFVESADAVGDCLDPHRVGVVGLELDSPIRVVVQEEYAAAI